MPERLCRHFGTCGGCSAQDIPYPQQLARKQQAIETLMKQHHFDTTLDAVHPSPQIWYYRNKMEFAFFEENGSVVCGLHKPGRHYEGFSLKECRIFSEEVPLLIAAVEEEARQQQYTAYDKYAFKGFLRHVVVRESKALPQRMINIVTTSERPLDEQSLVQRLTALSLDKKIVSVLWTINDSVSDAVVVQRQKVIFGGDSIEELVGGLYFKIFPQSFFQVNPAALPAWYETIRKYAGLTSSQRLLDVYSGIGGIGLCMARHCDFVWGIELLEELVKNACLNASVNRIKNISFVRGDVSKVLPESGFFKGAVQVMTVNPPRSGLSKKVIKRMCEVNPATIVYSSCNPASFLQDIKGIMERVPYRLASVEAFDFFPHTPHVEVVGVLRK